MTEGVNTIIYPVRDLARAMYGGLADVEPYADEVYYVGGQDVGLHPNGHRQGMTGPLAYWHVDDFEKSLKALLDAGAEARGKGCRWRQADRLRERPGRQRHRASPVTLVARVTDNKTRKLPSPLMRPDPGLPGLTYMA